MLAYLIAERSDDTAGAQRFERQVIVAEKRQTISLRYKFNFCCCCCTSTSSFNGNSTICV